MELITLLGITVPELIFVVASILGMVCHWLKQYMTEETEEPIYKWFGSSNWRATISSIGSCLFMIVAALGMGVLPAGATFWTALYMGLVTGFSVDAGMNADKKRKTPIQVLANKTVAKIKKQTSL